jgi:shikimate dehydrogenase
MGMRGGIAGAFSGQLPAKRSPSFQPPPHTFWHMLRMTSPALQEIIALFGCPSAGNPAQYLFERAIEAAGLDWRFLTLDVNPENLAAAIAGAGAMGFRGCLLSGPLRTAALPLMATASPAAKFSGAVSLIERQPAGFVGHMTDGRGVVEALRHHVDPVNAHVLIAGAGAAAHATALELSLAGVAGILICDRTPERAAALVEALTALEAAPAETLPWQDAIEIPERVGIVVSAVPSESLKPPGQKHGVEFKGMRSDLVVADFALVTQPSPVVALAARAGACAVDGLEIHCEKTAIDFHAWTGIEPDTEMLREALDEFLNA